MKAKLFCLILIVFSLGLPSYAGPDPMQIAGGARSIAMGRTVVVQPGDVNSIFLNPANAAYLKQWNLTSMYSSLLEGEITYTLIGGSQTSDYGTVGVAYLNAGTTGIGVTSLGATGRVVATGTSFDYFSSVTSFVYGKKLLDNLAVGINLKYFNESFTNQTGGTASGRDLDLGLIYQARDDLFLGFAQQNILPQKNGGEMVWGTGAKEGIPFKSKTGLAYFPHKDLVIAADLDYARSTPLLLHSGIEWQASPALALRAGLEQTALSTNDTAINLTVGLGLKSDGLSYDYAYYFDNSLSANSTHYFTISYSPPREYKREKEIAKAREHLQKKAPKKEIIFSDVPQDFWAHDAIYALARANIINGFPDGTYKPEKVLTRAELSTLLIKSKGLEIKEENQEVFTDIPNHHWAKPYIREAVREGLVNGYPDRTFRPNQGINREEAVKVNSEYDQLRKEVQDAPFKDVAKDRWSAKYISAAKRQRWLDYINSDRFSPKQEFTRAEAAYILYKTRFIKRLLAN